MIVDTAPALVAYSYDPFGFLDCYRLPGSGAVLLCTNGP